MHPNAIVQPDMPIPDTSTAHAGTLALLVGHNHKYYLIRLSPGDKLQTHRGEIEHNDLIGLPWGSVVKSHLKRTFYLLEPTAADLINEMPHCTQIIYEQNPDTHQFAQKNIQKLGPENVTFKLRDIAEGFDDAMYTLTHTF